MNPYDRNCKRYYFYASKNEKRAEAKKNFKKFASEHRNKRKNK